jgi:putative ABC transport system permease protein
MAGLWINSEGKRGGIIASNILEGIAMISNYLKTALRNLSRNRLYSIISIVGLAIGLGGCLLIVTYLNNELSFEHCYRNMDRIYRVDGLYVVGDGQVSMANISAPVGPAIKEACPEVEDMTRFRRVWDAKVEFRNGDIATESKFLLAEPAFLSIFTIPMKEGNPQTALEAPFSVIISNEIRKKYFPDQNPIGQTIKVNDQYECQITGVFETLPPNTQLQTNFIASYSSLEKMGTDLSKWTDILNDYTYLLLKENADPQQLEQKIPSILEPHMGDDAKSMMLRLQPLKQIYLHSNLSYELPPQGNLTYVYIFSCVAIVILIIACINFINLATARSSHRIKEVGVRKTLGAMRPQLVKQFLSESVLITVISMCLGVILFELALPQLEAFLGRDLPINIYRNPTILFSILGMVGIVGLLSGSYPALILSKQQTTTALRGSPSGGRTKATFRRVLVTLQFTIAIAIVCATAIIYSQIKFTSTADLGYDKDNMLIWNFDEKTAPEKVCLMKQQILENTNIVHVSAIRVPPAGGYHYLNSVHPENKPEGEYVLLSMFFVDYDFLSTFNIKMVEGRYFTVELAAQDKYAIVINEAALKTYGIDNPLGFKFYGQKREYNVIGVVKDFHNISLKNNIPPLALLINPNELRRLAVKLPAENQSVTMASIEKIWKRVLPDQPISFQFLEDLLKKDYEGEHKAASLFTVFSILAIVIACLGLFGLAAFMAEKRTKEIGIRKVLGASISNIVQLMSKEVLILIVIANVIAIPIAYYIGNKWLQSFAYRIQLGWTIFALSGVMVMAIALLTVSSQALKAALANPVDSLRYE